MVILGFDYGSRRVGVARGHSQAKLASPLKTLTNNSQLMSAISEVINQEQATELVVGLPRGLDGQETAQTATVRAFGRQLAKDTGLPLHWQDEAATSVEAQKQLKKGKNSSVDTVAATLILQDYLDNL